jgi:hypothetical protein
MTEHDGGALGLIWPPKDEPEVRRANARSYVMATNEMISGTYDTADLSHDRAQSAGIYVILEVARNAYDAHGIVPEAENGTNRRSWLGAGVSSGCTTKPAPRMSCVCVAG